MLIFVVTCCTFVGSGWSYPFPEWSLWLSAASFLTLQICGVRQQNEVVSFGFCPDLWSVLPHCRGVFECFSHRGRAAIVWRGL